MPGRNRRVRTAARLEGRQQARSLAGQLGRKIWDACKRRGWSQRVLGERIGLSPSRIGQIERGRATGASIELLCTLSAALGIPLKIDFLRDAIAEPVDAGHLKLQELVRRLGRMTGRA